MIRPKLRPTYNERHQKIIDMIDRLDFGEI
jgi:uncharacterized protein (DUF2249 family)